MHAIVPGSVGLSSPGMVLWVGIWTDQFLAPYEAYLPEVADFAELAASMIRYQVACAPWTLVAGDLSANTEQPSIGLLGEIRSDVRAGSLTVGGKRTTDTFGRTDQEQGQVPPWGQAVESGRVLTTGSDPSEIAPALSAAPYGREDIAIVFDRLDFGNHEVQNYFWTEDSRILLTCFALARPQDRPLFADTLADPDNGPVHPVQAFVSVGYKLGGDRYPCPAIADAVVRMLGPGLVVGQTMG
ncbi:hypothetical protein ACFVVM_03270 [Nocardia sp. NPDC058176]|uniref:hypothetical protein n=1 Tax=Nocardia sp. NPDC058176 TaxID=3346368 RepID=UPI0036D7613B